MKNLRNYLASGIPSPSHSKRMGTKPAFYDTRTVSAISKRRRLIRKMKHQGELI